EALVEAVRTAGLDVLESTPAHVRHLLDAGLFAVRDRAPSVVVLGGEAVPAPLWSALREQPGVRSWNFYGPTEATVDTLTARLDLLTEKLRKLEEQQRYADIWWHTLTAVVLEHPDGRAIRKETCTRTGR
ncbi:AMP-binding protein, partial [Streptomyces sp. MBT57]|nr:AMP-binding protein [Streptomyces sp. MBT57]